MRRIAAAPTALQPASPIAADGSLTRTVLTEQSERAPANLKHELEGGKLG